MEKYLDFLDKGYISNDIIPTASWLKDFNEKCWTIKSGNKKKQFNWEEILPDGTLLTDYSNEYHLNVCKRILFEVYNTSNSLSLDRLGVYHKMLINFTIWVYWNEDYYHPKKYAFSHLDSDAIKLAISDFVDGRTTGWINRKGYLDVFFENLISDPNERSRLEALSHYVPSNILSNIDAKSEYANEDLILIKTWIYDKLLYKHQRVEKCKNRSRNDIRYKKLYLEKGYVIVNTKELLSVAYSINSRVSEGHLDNNFEYYCRQFGYVDNYDYVALFTHNSGLEYLPSDYISLDGLQNVKVTIGHLNPLTSLFNVFSQFTHFIDGLPNEQALSSVDVITVAKGFGAGGDKHHRTTPVEIAFKILGDSIEFFLEYNQATLELIKSWKGEYQRLRANRTGVTPWTDNDCRTKALENISIPKELKPLRINRWSSVFEDNSRLYKLNEFGGSTGAKELREDGMSIVDLVKFLQSSGYIIISALMARRLSEITTLKRNCITGELGSYQLEFKLRKAGHEGERPLVRRPAPNIVKDVVDFLNEVIDIQDQSTDYIFSIYNPHRENVTSEPQKNIVLNNSFRFCDYIESPMIKEGQRWYPKAPEYRRFFAMIFFWNFKFSNISAISWMLGHVNPKQTLEYIKELIGGKELTKEEAKYTADTMLSNDTRESISDLRLLATKYFNCSDISLINKDDLEVYLEGLLLDNVLEIIPYGIETDDGLIYDMVFEIKEVDNE